MSELDAYRQDVSPDLTTGTYSKQLDNADNMSTYSSKQDQQDLASQAETFNEQKQKIQEYHIKNAKYKQKQSKLKKEHDYLSKKLSTLKLKVAKLEEHRAQDAEALLEHEDRLAQYKHANSKAKEQTLMKSLKTAIKQENVTRSDLKKCAEGTSKVHEQVIQLAPSFYEDLRKLKFYGDKAMNEVLLRQINIYVERLLDKSKEFEKLKSDKLEQNTQLRSKLRQKYKDHDQLKIDAFEDYSTLYKLQRKFNFYETDYILDREQSQNTTQAGLKANKSKSVISVQKSMLNETGASVFDSGIITATEQEKIDVESRNIDILSRLKGRLSQSEHIDLDIQKVIEKLPNAE